MGLSLQHDSEYGSFRVYLDLEPDRNPRYVDPRWRFDLGEQAWVGGRDDRYYQAVIIEGHEHVWVIDATERFVQKRKGQFERGDLP